VRPRPCLWRVVDALLLRRPVTPWLPLPLHVALVLIEPSHRAPHLWLIVLSSFAAVVLAREVGVRRKRSSSSLSRSTPSTLGGCDKGTFVSGIEIPQVVCSDVSIDILPPTGALKTGTFAFRALSGTLPLPQPPRQTRRQDEKGIPTSTRQLSFMKTPRRKPSIYGRIQKRQRARRKRHWPMLHPLLKRNSRKRLAR